MIEFKVQIPLPLKLSHDLLFASLPQRKLAVVNSHCTPCRFRALREIKDKTKSLLEGRPLCRLSSEIGRGSGLCGFITSSAAAAVSGECSLRQPMSHLQR